MPFITLEGIEGSGKSTQARRLGQALGPDTVITREPGGTTLGRRVREILLDPEQPTMAPEAELLLYFADRAQHVFEVVRPALAAGRTVFCDRYVESSLAYQGYGRGIDRELIHAVARLATGGLRPDLILFLDVPVPLGMARVGERGARDRLERELVQFHERVRAGYFEMMAGEAERWAHVSGEGEPDAVAARIMAVLEERGLVAAHGIR